MAAAHETSVVTCERLSVLRAPEALDGLARLAGEHFDRVEVVAFLRRPDHAVGSYYGQAVKAGMSSRDAAQFVAKQARPLDLHAVMRRWQKVFGEDAVRAWPYLERYKSDRDAGLEVLFHHLGIASPRGDARWASPDRPVNVRLSAEATEYVRLLNPRVPRWRVDGSWNGTQRNALLREVSARFPGTDAAAPPDVVAAVVTAFPAEPVVDLFRGSADADAAALWDEWLDQPAGQGAEPPSLSAAQVDALAAQVFAPAGPVVADGALPRRLARAAAATTSAASATSGSSLTRAVRRRLGRLRRRLTQGRPQG